MQSVPAGPSQPPWFGRASGVLETEQPTIGFVGIHSGGRPNQPVSKNETLAELFASVGYDVRRSSSVRNRTCRTVHQVLSILSWRKVDVMVVAVFSGTSFWIASFSTLLGKLMNKRIVLFLHGGNLPEFGPLHRRRVSRAFDRADLILAPSAFLSETFVTWGYDVRVVPNVLPIERYSYRHRTSARPNLLWMRTFHPHYDPEMAVRVLARVAEHHGDARMTMAGADHGSLAATKAEAERLGVTDRIDFVGYIDLDRKRDAFAEHDIFLNTNRLDNMPVSLLEATASGLVPVATAVGGIPSLVSDGVDGILVPAGDDEAMADAVLDLIASPDRMSALSESARMMALRSSWSAVWRRWTEELSLVLPEFYLP